MKMTPTRANVFVSFISDSGSKFTEFAPSATSEPFALEFKQTKFINTLPDDEFVDIDAEIAAFANEPGGREALAAAASDYEEVKRLENLSLREFRLDRGISQTQLAALACMKQPSIARIESGRGDPRLSTFVRLSSVLDVPLLDVVGAFVQVCKQENK
ncbi:MULTISPECIES: helix-turn-helix domain-containing protein [Pandoraea]|uniref:helix-turn-helix domain-containing protein n=1 Tax=Pandoraea TaxID=93217 RepID=UPI0009B89B7E|nr:MULTISPECIES: helix-turn-helix transcriptional regulator [Pandoraea]